MYIDIIYMIYIYIYKQDTIWGQVEPDIDDQLSEYNEVPKRMKESAKDKFKENTVDKAVDAMCDEALEKMKKDKDKEN